MLRDAPRRFPVRRIAIPAATCPSPSTAHRRRLGGYRAQPGIPPTTAKSKTWSSARIYHPAGRSPPANTGLGQCRPDQVMIGSKEPRRSRGGDPENFSLHAGTRGASALSSKTILPPWRRCGEYRRASSIPAVFRLSIRKRPTWPCASMAEGRPSISCCGCCYRPGERCCSAPRTGKGLCPPCRPHDRPNLPAPRRPADTMLRHPPLGTRPLFRPLRGGSAGLRHHHRHPECAVNWDSLKDLAECALIAKRGPHHLHVHSSHFYPQEPTFTYLCGPHGCRNTCATRPASSRHLRRGAALSHHRHRAHARPLGESFMARSRWRSCGR